MRFAWQQSRLVEIRLSYKTPFKMLFAGNYQASTISTICQVAFQDF